MAKRIGRHRFLDERAGEAQLIQRAARAIGERSQPAAIRNQFLKVDLDKEEAKEIVEATHKISAAAAELRDVLEGIRLER